MSRLESPNSINTFNNCKRKYYYTYKLNLPRKDTISTITGKAVHDALENFFKIDINLINKENYETEFKHNLLNSFNDAWFKSLKNLLTLCLEKESIREYYEKSIFMLQNFFEDYIQSFKNELLSSDIASTFNKLKPKTEIYLRSEKYNVHGYVDAIIEIGNELYIIDYKTSSRDNFSEDYKLQLAIYALLYNEKFDRLPDKVGLHFLKHGTKKFIEVNQELLELAKKETELIQLNTTSNDIKDYEKNPGPFCKWRDGQCAFYDLCFGMKTLNNFNDNKIIQINKE